VDGVYEEDPEKDKTAKRYDTVDYNTVLSKDLKVMDATAISLCREHRLPILVFNLTRPGNILRALRGESVGTIVKGG